MRACHPYLRGGGVIVNLGSGAGLRGDAATLAFYGSMKEAIRFLGRVAAVEWAGDGIRVHTLLPLAETDAVSRWAETMPEEAAALFRTVPLGRLGDPERDIGPVLVFLCSPESAYMTGGAILVDGGKGFLR
jgi:NAD(P)-dependent dehydrogenase (short-subunit alcohol dehydrogenase family)